MNFQVYAKHPAAALPWRGRALDQLAARRFDLLVIGGGIIGAGVADGAARSGLAVALVDRADFGSQTSSASSKLIHGGLRYLRLGDVRLVREAHQERRALMHVVAPHLVRRLPFLVPLYRDCPYRPRTIQLALWLYSALARERLGGVVQPGRARRSVPALRLENLHGRRSAGLARPERDDEQIKDDRKGKCDPRAAEPVLAEWDCCPERRQKLTRTVRPDREARGLSLYSILGYTDARRRPHRRAPGAGGS